MARKSLKLYVISALVALTAGTVAYYAGYLDPLLVDRADQMAAVSDRDSRSNGNSETTEGGVPSKTNEKPAEIVPPRFDIVRVEPDGNVVIAGNAPAGSHVEVITGAKILGETETNAAGDFAVVLLDPLKPGDYTIVLRATTPEKLVAMSEETAIVSVPETKAGDVLAIVDKPGEPSKLITVPKPDQSDEAETEIAAVTPQPEAADDSGTRQSGGTETVDKTTTSAETESATENATETPAAPHSPVESGKNNKLEDSNRPEEKSVEEAENLTGDTQEQPGGTSSAEEPAVRSDPEQQESVQPDSSPQAETETEMAATATESQDSERQTVVEEESAAGPSIAVEAVEIEGDHVFVAGTADAGRIVRVYANKDLIGETQVSDNGRFLVESTAGLEVGEYIIRADLLELGSADVIARAAVPFEREPGETVAAVAPAIHDEKPPVKETESESIAPGETASSDGAEPAGESEMPDEPVGKSDRNDTPPATINLPETALAESREPNQPASDTEDREDETGSEPASHQAAISPGESEEQEVTIIGDSAATVDEERNGDENQGEADGVKVATADPGAIKYPELDNDIAVTAPKLEPTTGAVIIRRGDTLWHISRRVYGRGIRYTTIYTANKDQINDPDMIWPGQIFDVPAVSNEGDAADLEAIADRNSNSEEAGTSQ